MKGAILRRGERWYTHLSGVFSAISPVPLEYNWLITDYENYPEALEPFAGRMGKENFFWVPGEKLIEIVRHQDCQWYWGVFSGFKKNVPFKEVLNHKMPYADGYAGFWKNPVSIQHPLAEIEIVPWDSALTLLISKEEEVVQAFLNAFPMGEDLETFNMGEPEPEEWLELWEEAERRYGSQEREE